MGNNTNCCKNKRARDNWNNLDLIDEDKFQTSPAETKVNLTAPGESNKIKEEMKEEQPQIEIEKPESIIESRSKILYWNDKGGDIEDLMFDISDEASDKIFKLLNDMRTKPGLFINESCKYQLESIFQKAQGNDKKPNLLCKNEYFYYNIREILVGLNSTPKPDEDFINEITSHESFNKFETKVYVTDSQINTPEEAVWNLLCSIESSTHNSFNEILNRKSDFCIVCAMPIKNTSQIKVFFVFLNNKLRLSQIQI